LNGIETESVQEQLVTLEEAQGSAENIEQCEGIVGVLCLVCPPLDQALLFVDVLFNSANGTGLSLQADDTR
jgi:hypothetical protein